MNIQKEIGKITNARLTLKFPLTIPYTKTAPSEVPDFTYTARNTGEYLYTFAILAADTNTIVNYPILISSSAFEIEPNTYISFPSSGGYEPLPSGVVIELPPNATINFYSYNNSTSTTNATYYIEVLSDVK